ncbi:hypothetical protein ACQ4PT_070324 [Festuca glaucescens]
MDGHVVKLIHYVGCNWAPVCMNRVDDVLCVTGSLEGTPIAGMIDLITMNGLVTHLERDRAWGSGRAIPSGAYKAVRFKGSQECEVITIRDGDTWRKKKSFPFRFDCGSRDNYTAAINDDVVFDILSRIPVKSLSRFRCVSKGWYALISDNIIAVYKSRAEPLLVVGSRWDTSLRLIDVSGNVVKVIENVGYVWKLICTSRDNLVCVIGISSDVKVIDLASGKVVQTCRKTGLLGFGHTIPSGVHKVVYINPYSCEILTVGDGVGWRPMQLPTTSNISYARSPVVVNGVLHLVLRSHLDGNSVLCFNLASEEWMKAINGPPNLDLQKCDLWLSELNGSLCMVQPEDESCGTNIWLLTDSNKNTWVKVFTVPLDSCGYYQVKPLRILRDGKRLLFCNTHESTDLSSVQIYDSHIWDLIDAPNALAGVHGTNFSPCT